MARKKKGNLPSGSFRKQRLDYVDADGKKHYRSFTAPTEDEVNFMIAQWKLSRGEEPDRRGDLTVSEAVRRYIDSKSGVLSPATLRSYRGTLERRLEGSQLASVYLNDLTTKDLQIWVSDLAKDMTPKSVKNAFALVRSSIEMFSPDFRFKVTLPQGRPAELYCPSDEDVRNILKYISSTDPELEKAVLLAAFGPMRRSEISALMAGDVHGNTVTVNKALVRDEINAWVLKAPKTVSSNREIEYPDFVIQKITGAKGRVVPLTPDVITARFRRALKRTGNRMFRFHDLRHYAASIMHAIGVPDQYIMKRGGWATDTVMKRVYRNIIDVEDRKQTRIINEHFRVIGV